MIIVLIIMEIQQIGFEKSFINKNNNNNNKIIAIKTS